MPHILRLSIDDSDRGEFLTAFWGIEGISGGASLNVLFLRYTRHRALASFELHLLSLEILVMEPEENDEWQEVIREWRPVVVHDKPEGAAYISLLNFTLCQRSWFQERWSNTVICPEASEVCQKEDTEDPKEVSHLLFERCREVDWLFSTFPNRSLEKKDGNHYA